MLSFLSIPGAGFTEGRIVSIHCIACVPGQAGLWRTVQSLQDTLLSSKQGLWEQARPLCMIELGCPLSSLEGQSLQTH